LNFSPQSLATTRTELTATEKELQSTQKSAHESQVRREELDKEIEKINNTLRDVRDDHRKGKDEDRLLQAIASLKRHFPGVQGRLVDLCRPTQRRFNLAVTVAGGKDMDAIVVDSKQTGFDCMKYLRDNRVGVATFLPLDTLQIPTPESAERVRAMTQQDGRYRLAADVITCEESVKRAVLYAVGNTVICDDLDSARELCFGGRGGRRQSENATVKAVTIGGAVISKAGTMTGGVTRDDANRAGRFEDQEVEKLREKKEQLETERADLDNVGSRTGGRESFGHVTKIEELRNKLGNLNNRNQYAQSDLEYTTKQLREKKSLFESTKKQMVELEKQVESSENDVAMLSKSVTNAIQAVKEAEDEHLGPFREETGLRDLKAYEEAVGKAREEFNLKMLSIMEHITKLEQQKDYETGRDFKTPIARCEKRLNDRRLSLESVKERSAELEEQVSEAKATLAHAESTVKKAADKEKSFDDAVQAAQSAYSDAQTERNKMSKAITSAESALERLRGKLHETLQKARVEEVDLPVVGVSSSQVGRVRSSHRSPANDEDDTQNTASDRTSDRAMTQETTATTHFSQADDTRVVKDRKDAAKIDFSQMATKFKQRLSDRDEKKVRKDFEDKLSNVARDIESMAPNMKAGEAFEAATERMKESTSDWDRAKGDSRKATLAFQKIKSQRAKLFNKAFEHIDEALKTIYKDMTKSSKHPLGGNAYLSLDDTEEPYKGGMKFNAMPPLVSLKTIVWMADVIPVSNLENCSHTFALVL
jgi:structural maintenance of chromosome 1